MPTVAEEGPFRFVIYTRRTTSSLLTCILRMVNNHLDTKLYYRLPERLTDRLQTFLPMRHWVKADYQQSRREETIMRKKVVNYNSIAKVYNRRYEENDYNGIQQCLLDFIGKQSEGVLEVGCGTGHWLITLAVNGCKATGIEPNLKMLEIAKQKLPEANIKHGQAESLPWEGETFNRVFCINAIHHFKDSQKFMIEARRVLKKTGGIMVVGLDPHTGLDSWWIYDYFPQVIEIDRKRYISAQNIRKLMAENGLTDCSTVEAQHMQICMPARKALDNGRLAKTSTSQLALLSDEEYIRGIDQIRSDIQKSEEDEKVLHIGLDLRIYATTGWVR
jgi:ubiquinone/menaquinone biosynthesis C-methylase UbiE